MWADTGEVSFTIAKKHAAVCVITAEPCHTQQLFDSCATQNLDNILYLRKNLSLADIAQLGTCEHFDVVIVTNFYNRFKNE